MVLYELFDVEDKSKPLENTTHKLKLENNIYKIEILQQRYKLVRDEIIMRLEHRYKLMQFLLALIPISYAAIAISELYYISLLMCVLIFIIAMLFYSENRSILDESNYLQKLEYFIDINAALPIQGWETYGRDPKMKKIRATRTLHTTFLFLFILSYSFYNCIFSYHLPYINESITQLVNLKWNIFDCRISVFIVLELPILIFATHSYNELNIYFQR